jgi:DNA-directed RNA polymerase I subunit RPA1
VGGGEEADEEEADLGDGPKVRKGGRAGGGNKGSKGTADEEEEEEEDDDDEEVEDDDEAQGTLKFGRKKERGEYDADEPEEEDEEERTEEGKERGSESEEEDEEEDEEAKGEAGKGGGKRDGKRGSGNGNGSGNGLPSTPRVLAGASKIEHPFLEDVAFRPEAGVLQVTLKTRASHRRLLMVTLAEAAAERCTVRASRGISQAFVVEDKAEAGGAGSIQTEGCNLQELWEVGDGLLQLGSITSNDIWAIHQTYGVEAARATIVNEIKGVFGAYGIAVDPRHLGLVADFMTYQGGFRALNRMGMAQVSSPFLQMSFETTAAFLTEAALAAEKDNLETPSAKLVMGQATGNGTGCFDLMVPIDMGAWAGVADGKRGSSEAMEVDS